MSERLSPDNFGLKLYNRFPPNYRRDDSDQKYALKRYLESAADGGFRYIIEEQNGLLDSVDPQVTPLQTLLLLYQQYGLEVFNGIPESFLRSFLPDLGSAWSKKGSLNVIEYIVSSLSGIKTSTDIEYDDNGNPTITVRLEMDFTASDYFPDSEQFERILNQFVPFYCNSIMVYSYVYYESQNISSQEEYDMEKFITDNVDEPDLDVDEYVGDYIQSSRINALEETGVIQEGTVTILNTLTNTLYRVLNYNMVLNSGSSSSNSFDHVFMHVINISPEINYKFAAVAVVRTEAKWDTSIEW